MKHETLCVLVYLVLLMAQMLERFAGCVKSSPLGERLRKRSKFSHNEEYDANALHSHDRIVAFHRKCKAHLPWLCSLPRREEIIIPQV